MTDKTDLIDAVKGKFADQILDQHNFRGDQTVTVKKDALIPLCLFLRDDPALAFDFLMDLTAVDYYKKNPVRYEVVYHFYSTKYNTRFRVKIPVSEDDCILETVCELWKTANWFEREIWDMYGIRFKGHPNLKRILMYEGFKGHPLRKDYPINKRQPLIGPLN